MDEFNYIIEQELSKTIGIGNWRLPHFFDKPITLGGSKQQLIGEREIISFFFKKVADLARIALLSDDDELIQLLFSETPAGMDIEYHKNLPDCCWDSPMLYRTDQSLSGKIYEIQAPGSGWGDLYLYALCLKHMGYELSELYFDFPKLYADTIANITGKIRPNVFYMIDAASVPYSARYLQYITSDRIKYWGLNCDVKMGAIDCLISHSVVSSTTSNFFKTYLQMATEGKLFFSTPPNLIFDEKAIYILPFHRKTRSFFSDEIRSIFPYTTFIENSGFFDVSGEFVLIKDFVKRKPHERKYYLKYGGPDTNRNWGSKSVFRLNGNDCERLLNNADRLSRNGEIWLIQEDVSQSTPSDISKDIDNILREKYHMKISGYYSRDRLFGVKIMARHHFKVHGQEDTLVGLGT